MNTSRKSQVISHKLKSVSPGLSGDSGLMTRDFRASRGFTLIELMVSVTIFSIVMLIAAGSLLSMVDANRKAQSLKAVVNNLSFAMDGMARTFRDGSNIHCGQGGVSIGAAQDCTTGDTYIGVEKYGGSISNPNDQYVYCLGSDTSCSSSGTSIMRSTTGGAANSFLPITAPEVVITQLQFIVQGAVRSESPKIQPRVTMIVRGYAGANNRIKTEIRLQTTITQRLYDE